ncbi:MAG TPA: hypothetical protein VFN70_18035 [Burkholderiales bacterium]|nr:hypothetical protein [Burkholderiales bacterium]
MSAPLPTAKWSGTIMGIRVHVLDNGQRIIDAEDLTTIFERIATGDLDPTKFGEAMARFKAGEVPSLSESNDHG